MKLYKGMRGKNNGLLDLINILPDNIVMVEVGCYAGESTLMFVKSNKIKHLYAIDPWCNDRNSLWCTNIQKTPLTQKKKKIVDRVFGNMEWAEQSFDVRMGPYKNVTKLKMTLEQAMPHLPELDFVYIDGDHSYEAVLKDIMNSKKIIKPSGIIAGHDYNKNCLGVVKAVNESFEKSDLVFYRDSSWLVQL